MESRRQASSAPYQTLTVLSLEANKIPQKKKVRSKPYPTECKRDSPHRISNKQITNPVSSNSRHTSLKKAV